MSTVDEPASLPHSSAITAVGRATQSPRAEGYPGGRAGSVCVCVCMWGGVTLSSKNLGLSVLVGEPVSLSLLPPQDIQQNRNSHVVP